MYIENENQFEIKTLRLTYENHYNTLFRTILGTLLRTN